VRRNADERGFTLIEVLVATAVTALILLPLLRSFSAGLTAKSRSGSLTDATLVAESAMETIGATVSFDQPSSFDRQDGRYHVSTEVHPYGSSDSGGSLRLPLIPYEIVVTVAWNEGAETRSLALRTLRLGSPPPSEAGP
jgi:prepilin-type N-terminal cleavage/methylation domain-containing protein